MPPQPNILKIIKVPENDKKTQMCYLLKTKQPVNLTKKDDNKTGTEHKWIKICFGIDSNAN